MVRGKMVRVVPSVRVVRVVSAVANTTWISSAPRSILHMRRHLVSSVRSSLRSLSDKLMQRTPRAEIHATMHREANLLAVPDKNVGRK